MTTETTASAENQTDYSSLPASAFPEGVDPAAYVASLKGGDETPSDKPQRPEHVPEKFWDAEKGEARWDDLAKSYGELERRYSATVKPDDKADDKPSLKMEAKAEDAQGEAEANPLTTALESFAQAYADNAGQVTEEQIAELAKLGIPEQTIQTYLAGLEALAQDGFRQAHELAGGKDKFEAAMTWAQNTFAADDIDAYNDLIEKGRMKQGVEWLMAKFNAARPSEGSFAATEAAATFIGDVFRSQAEVSAAIRDERYKRDPAYQKSVLEKLQRTRDAEIYF